MFTLKPFLAMLKPLSFRTRTKTTICITKINEELRCRLPDRVEVHCPLSVPLTIMVAQKLSFEVFEKPKILSGVAVSM